MSFNYFGKPLRPFTRYRIIFPTKGELELHPDFKEVKSNGDVKLKRNFLIFNKQLGTAEEVATDDCGNVGKDQTSTKVAIHSTDGYYVEAIELDLNEKGNEGGFSLYDKEGGKTCICGFRYPPFHSEWCTKYEKPKVWGIMRGEKMICKTKSDQQ